ncbi:putative ribonuclease H-like domain-containing protein [Tanacetum coccineum]
MSAKGIISINNDVPPPYTGNFMPPKPDLVYPSLDDFVDVNESVSESIVKKLTVETNEPKNAKKENGAPIIEDWVSESEEEDVPKGTRVNTARPKVVFSVVKGNKGNTVKASACWVWKPTHKVLDHVSRHNGASMNFKRFDYIDAQGNRSYLTDYEEIDGGFVAFGGNSKGGKITRKGKIRTGKLDFEDVYFVKELKFNLFSVSQMCDKKNSVLLTDTECIVLSPEFKLTDEVLLVSLQKLHQMNLIFGIGGIENLIDLKVKVIRCDNGTEFKNRVMVQLCEMKDIKREFSVARTPQQNRVAERKKRTLIEAARTMLADLKFLTTFWAEVVNTACYVQNKVLVIKPHNKTPYELFLGRKTALSFMRPFGCPVTILNTIDHQGKFDEKANEGFFVGYSTNSKAFRVFNSRTRIVEENLHVQFSENTPNIAGSGPNWLFDIDALTKSMNYKPVITWNQSNGSAGTKACDDAGKARMETVLGKDYILLPLWTQDPPFSSSLKDYLDDGFKPSGEEEKKDAEDPGNEDSEVPKKEEPRVNQEKNANVNSTNNINTVSPTVNAAGIENNVVFRNKKDERGIVIKTKARLVTQGYTQEEGIDYDKVFDPVARIKAIRLFLAYASFKDFVVYQMDVKSTFLYGKIEEEFYVCQPPGFEDPNFPDRVNKVEKALYGLHQAPRAWYETLSTYFLDNGFQRGNIEKTLFIRRDKGDILLVQVYVDDIIFGSTKKSLCTEFEKMMYKKFQMSSIVKLTFVSGLQEKQKEDGIFISQDKYVIEILKKFGFSDVKTVSTPMETHKSLLKDLNREDVDEHLYRSMIGSLMYLTSSRSDIMFAVCACARLQVNPKTSHIHDVKRIFRYLKGQPKLGIWYPRDTPFDLVAYTDSDYAGASLDRKSTTGGCQFLGCRLISWQCKKQTVVANSTTEAEYIATSNCLKNLVFYSKTKHIEIRNQFIRDSNKKKLIQMIKIQTYQNVADLITKAFDVSRFQYLIASNGMLNL